MTKRAPFRLILAVAGVLCASAAGAADSAWRDFDDAALREDGRRVLVPLRYRAVALDRDALHEALAQAPLEFTADAADKALSVVVALPMPDGTSLRFRVEESPIMEPGLAARFPDIKTYRGQGLDDGTATTRFGWTSAGFHAIVLAERGTVYIDPYRRGDTEHYVSFFKRDYRRPAGDSFRCLLDDADAAFDGPDAPASFAPSGDILRTYRLALATTVEYSDFHSTQNPPSKTDVMNNGLIPSMNRVNGVYERDLALRMVMVANNMDVIYVVEPDPYTNSSGSQMLRPEPGQPRPRHRQRELRHRPRVQHRRRRRGLPARALHHRLQGPGRDRPRQPDRGPLRHRLRRPRDGPPVGREPHLQRQRRLLRGRQPQRRHRLRGGQRLHHPGLRRHLRLPGPAAQQRRLLPQHQLRGDAGVLAERQRQRRARCSPTPATRPR